MANGKRAEPHLLDNTREPNMRPLLVVALGVLALLLAGAWVVHTQTRTTRIANIQQALAVDGRGVLVEARPTRGCLRASARFYWRTATAEGYACAGPGDKVVLHPGAAK